MADTVAEVAGSRDRRKERIRIPIVTNRSCVAVHRCESMLRARACKILLQHGVMRWLLSGGPIGSAPECKEEGNHGILCWIGYLDERDAHLRGGPQWQGHSGGQGAEFAWGDCGRAGEGAGDQTYRLRDGAHGAGSLSRS